MPDDCGNQRVHIQRHQVRGKPGDIAVTHGAPQVCRSLLVVHLQLPGSAHISSTLPGDKPFIPDDGHLLISIFISDIGLRSVTSPRSMLIARDQNFAGTT